MQYQIKDATPFSHFAMIPNMVDDMGLSPYAYRLYGHLKRVTGEGGACWQNTQELAKVCGMSTGMISKAKKELMGTTPPLIVVVLTSHPKEGKFDYHEITILNIWDENKRRYGSLYEQSVHKVNSERSPHEQHGSLYEPKNNPIKNNHKKKKEDTPDGATPRTPTIQQQMVEVLAALTGMDYHIKSNASRLGKTASELVSSGYKPENVKAFAQYWRNDDWRGRKGDKPKLSQVTELIGVVRNGIVRDDPLDVEALRRAVREAKPADDGMEY